MPFLYEKLNAIREYVGFSEVPSYIHENINPRFELRPYQIGAFENFINYFEIEKMCPKPTQTLFHMATGAGKTLIMAGLLLYLYEKGYRNFLFFVNLGNIVNKTKDNFTNPLSTKYLFAHEVRLSGANVPIKEVNNFQNSDENAINICFTTTQGLHDAVWFTKEDSISFDDFAERKVVLISDEAHHLNVDTKKIEKDKEEQKSYHSWEETVRRIFNLNKNNVLLEFTATCDTKNPQIRKEYEDKIIFDYDLVKFRADGYSKEIKTLRSDVTTEERALQALILSQYRYKVFQDHHQSIKPVVFFKSRLVKDNAQNMSKIIAMTQSLTGAQIRQLLEQSSSETIGKAHRYFLANNISYDELASELRDDFSEEHCISANDNQDVEKKQRLLNSLEDSTNPYRAVFAVDKLNEGWDVLNLFDIVRLYETRQSSGKKISPATISEAQLIGRGARYCPFQIDSEQEKFKRKYDADVENPLRVCEELYYHCQNDSRYIAELNSALREIGIDIEKRKTCSYILKDSFKSDSLYTDGLVFVNERKERDRTGVRELSPDIRNRIYSVRLETGSSGEDTLFDNSSNSNNGDVSYIYRTTISKVAQINYAIVHKALCKYSVLKFDSLNKYFPNLKSTREFIFSSSYLGAINIEITSKYKEPTPSLLFSACVSVLKKVSETISTTKVCYAGTTTFKPTYIHDVFRDKKCNYTVLPEGGVGISQNDLSVESSLKIDLSKEDWFAFEDHFGTSEEKAFVAYFKNYVPELKAKYNKVFLVRNERQLHVYTFDEGERFEPDFLLFLQKNNDDGYEQLQVFIEPKGENLLEADKMKETFLLALKDKAVAQKIFVDDNKYRIWGLHFFNRSMRMKDFADDMHSLSEPADVEL